MPKQAPSGRASDTLTLSFGLITIPVALYAGVDSKHGIHRQEVIEVEIEDEEGNKTIVDHPVGRGAIDKVTGDLVSQADVVRKIPTDYGLVYVEPAEEETLFKIEPKSMVVQCFQPLALFVSGEHYVPRAQYFIEPAKTKVGSKKIVPDGTKKAFAMLLKAMREEGVFAIVEYTSRGLPKPAALMPNGTLWQLHHTDACREQRPLDEVEIDDQTVQMGRLLIQQNLSKEVQDLTNRRAELIQAFAEEKAEKGEFSKPADTFVAQDPEAAPNDLLAKLQQSLAAAQTDLQAKVAG